MRVVLAPLVRRLVLAGALAFVAGCMFFRSLDELTAEAPVEAGIEAGTTEDGAAEASTLPPKDAALDGTDAPIGVDVVNPTDAGGFCERGGTRLLCDDFPDGSLSNWVKNNAEGALSPEPVLGDTEPGAAAISLGPVAGSCVYTNLTRQFPGSFRRARLSFSMWVDPAHSFGAKAVANLIIGSYGPGNSICQLVLYAGTAGLSLFEQRVNETGVTSEVPHTAGAGIAAGTWARIVLEQNFAAQTISLQVNGVSRVAAAPAPCAIEPDPIIVDVGFVCTAAAANQRFLIDDVLIEGD